MLTPLEWKYFFKIIFILWAILENPEHIDPFEDFQDLVFLVVLLITKTEHTWQENQVV